MSAARLNKKQQEIVKERILEEACRFFDEKGYEDTKTKEISERVGIAEGTLFNYFQSKAHLFLECVASKYILIEKTNPEKISTSENPVDIIFEFLCNTFKGPLSLPKKVLKEMAHILTYFSKKKENLLKQLAMYDYKALFDLETLLKDLTSKDKLNIYDFETASSTLFSNVCFEILTYIYVEDYSKEDLKNSLYRKIEFTLRGWINTK